MTVVEKHPIPIYSIICPECGSVIEYKKSEVHTCHICCPVCGVSMWADTIRPVRMDYDEKEQELCRGILNIIEKGY